MFGGGPFDRWDGWLWIKYTCAYKVRAKYWCITHRTFTQIQRAEKRQVHMLHGEKYHAYIHTFLVKKFLVHGRYQITLSTTPPYLHHSPFKARWSTQTLNNNYILSNGWSLIRSVIIPVITKSDDPVQRNSDLFVTNIYRISTRKTRNSQLLNMPLFKTATAKEHFTIVWYLFGTLYLKILS